MDPAAALAGLLPQAAVAGQRIDRAGPLWPGEDLAIQRAGPARRAEFAAGRSAARLALAKLGAAPQSLPRGPLGPPQWPSGFIGSISHAGGWALAAVAPATPMRAIGIDIEPLTAIVPLAEIASAAEIARNPDPLRLFCAKEAAYKTIFPLTGEMLGFDAMAVTLDASGFTARLTRASGPFAAGSLLTGSQARAGDLLVTACALRA